MSKKIFIIQHYSPNKGNLAVLHTMLQALAQAIREAEFTVASYKPSSTAAMYNVDSVEWAVQIRDIKDEKRLLMRLVWIVLESLWILESFFWALFKRYDLDMPLWSKSKRERLEKYIQSDIVISPGGHLFTNLNRFGGLITVFYSTLLAEMLNKPLVIYAQTIGPFFGRFGSLSRLLTRLLLNRAELITVREDTSRKELSRLGITHPQIHLTADSVFLMSPPDIKIVNQILLDEGISVGDKRPLIGITIHHRYYSRCFKEEKYIKLMSQIADYLVEQIGARVVFVPMEMSYSRGGDRPFIIRIIESMKHHESTTVLQGEYDMQETMGTIGNMHAFVGTKTHSIAFALRMGVPLICVAYDTKSREFMRQFGQEDFVIDMSELTVDVFMNRMCSLWSIRSEITTCIATKLQDVQSSALLNAQLVADFLCSLDGARQNIKKEL